MSASINWINSHAANAAKMVHEYGIGTLCAFDGDRDGQCEIAGIHIVVDSHGPDARRYGVGILLRVWGQHMDMTRLDEMHVALACLEQLTGLGPSVGVRFCAEEDDAASRCTYCHAPRSRPENYLCDAHTDSRECPQWDGVTIADQHDARRNHTASELAQALAER